MSFASSAKVTGMRWPRSAARRSIQRWTLVLISARDDRKRLRRHGGAARRPGTADIAHLPLPVAAEVALRASRRRIVARGDPGHRLPGPPLVARSVERPAMDARSVEETERAVGH